MKTKKIKPVKARIFDEYTICLLKIIPDFWKFKDELTILPTSDYKAMLKELKRFKTLEKIANAWRKSLVPMEKFNKEGIWKWKFGGEIK